MADKIKYLLAWVIFIGIGIWLGLVVQERTPIKDGLVLRYEITSSQSSQKSFQTISFSKSKAGMFKVFTTGNSKKEEKDEVDKECFGKDGHLLTGPIGGILWIPPYTMEVGKEVMGSDVSARKQWHGYDVYVVEERNLENCRGYYDAKTGLQIGYQNFWSSEKLEAVLINKEG